MRSLKIVCVTVAVFLAITPSGFCAQSVETVGRIKVVRLSGSPYEIGYQHGTLLRDEVRSSISLVLRYFRRYLKIPGIRSLLVNVWLDRAWAQAMPYVPKDILEEMHGIANGAQLPLRELYRLHAVPERTYSCANFAAWGRATIDGKLIHMRNLDWNVDANIQHHPVIFVIRPQGKRAFVNVAWAGFVGVLTGINEQQISIGQIGAETTDVSFQGEPMAFVMRRVLEETASVDEAAQLITQAKRTVGTNYIIADAKAPAAIAVETNHTLARVFRADDPAEHAVSYARPIADAVLRADAAMDPEIRDKQIASRGNPKKPGLEDPAGSAYEVRYLGQANGLQASYGKLNAESAKQIARQVAPDSNVQSVVFAWPELWVANANNEVPAAKTAYSSFDLQRLFAQPSD